MGNLLHYCVFLFISSCISQNSGKELANEHRRFRRSVDVDDPNQIQKNATLPGGVKYKARAEENGSSGSVFTRWGRTSCPDSSKLVYAGIVGGSHYTHTGGGSNYLCMTSHPLWGDYNDAAAGYSYVYGTEYETGWPFQSDNIEGNNHANHDAPCAVCLTTGRLTNVMIPGRNECLGEGWTLEYHGYLMSGHLGHKGRAQFVCVDAAPEADPAGYESKDGALFYYTEAACGSLPCPPYVNGREITCAVCSK